MNVLIVLVGSLIIGFWAGQKRIYYFKNYKREAEYYKSLYENSKCIERHWYDSMNKYFQAVWILKDQIKNQPYKCNPSCFNYKARLELEKRELIKI